MIEISTPIWVEGTVVSYLPVNPHTMIGLDVRSTDGHVERWTVEGPVLSRLERYGLAGKEFLKTGDAIEVCGFAPKPQHRDPSNPASSHVVHGQVLWLPDARMQLWGPYGKLDNCVRAGDRSDAWVDFLSNPMARQIWCGPFQAAIPLSERASKTLVDEINERMANPCD